MWDVIAAKGFEKDMYFEIGRPRHPRAAEARGHGPRQHRPDRQVHGELLVRPAPSIRRSGAATTTPTTRSCSTRGRPRGLGEDPVPRLPAGVRALRPPAERRRRSRSRSTSSASCSRPRRRPRTSSATSTSCCRSASCSRWSSTPQLMLENAPVYSIPRRAGGRDLRRVRARLLASTRSTCTARRPPHTPRPTCAWGCSDARRRRRPLRRRLGAGARARRRVRDERLGRRGRGPRRTATTRR